MNFSGDKKMDGQTEIIEIIVTAKITGCHDKYDKDKAVSAFLAKLRNLYANWNAGTTIYTAKAELTGGCENGGDGGKQ